MPGLYPINSSVHNSARRPIQGQATYAADKPAQQQNEPRFGRNFFVNTGAKVFPAVTENFLKGFILMDIGYLWTSRETVSLWRGRKKHDADNDLSMRNKPWLERKLYSLKENIKGLNWPNGREELWREAETGPFLYVAQSVILTFSAMYFMGKQGLLTGWNHLHGMTALLKEVITAPAEKLKSADSLTKHYLQVLLKEKSSLNSNLDKTVANFWEVQHPIDKALTTLVKKTAQIHNLDPHKVTYGQVLDTWIDQWMKHTATRATFFDKAHYIEDEHLESAFRGWVQWAQLSGDKESVRKLKPSDYSVIHFHGDWVKQYPGSQGKRHIPMSIGTVLKNITKYRTFINDTHALAHYGFDSGFALETSPAQRIATFSQAADNILVKTIRTKGILTVLATAVAGYIVINVSKRAQSSNSYPANRAMQLHNLKARMQHYNPFNPASPFSPLQPGLDPEFGTQSAVSSKMGAQTV